MISKLDHLDGPVRSQVLALIAAAADSDGTPPVSEHLLLHLRHGGDRSDSHFIAYLDGVIAGYAHLDLTDQVEGPSGEVVVDPKLRKKGVGQALIEALIKSGGHGLRLWSHGDLEDARGIAAKKGLERVRTVAQMRRSLLDPIPEIVSKLEIRSFNPELDRENWLKLNNAAFADHPEQGAWSMRDLEIRMAESWFDSQGLLIAEEGGVMKGFTWCKIHGGSTHRHSRDEAIHDHDPIGEIYIMGVDPSARGRGIAKALTTAGLRYIRHQGIFTAMLYVDAENTGALNLYKSLDFKEWGRDVLYRYKVKQ